MTLNTRNYNNKEMLLFPASIGDYLPKDHLSWVIDEVVDQLDLDCLYRKVPMVGNPSYHPRMMLKVLFYGYATSRFSSRKIAQSLESDVAFIFLSGMQKPDFRTISDFRKNNTKELAEIFVQIIRLSREMGIIELGHISLDSTVIKASARRGNFYDKEQLDEEERKIKGILNIAKEIDDKEDKVYGSRLRGDELPKELQTPSKRLEKIKEAKKNLEEKSLKEINLTDPDATFQRQNDHAVRPGYRAEVSVDAKSQIIIACDVINKRTDYDELIPLIDEIGENLPEFVSKESIIITADSGYSSMDRLKELESKDYIDAYIPDAKYQGKERGKKIDEDSPFHKKHFIYNSEKDFYVCPNSKKLTLRCRRKEKSGAMCTIYQCHECQQCRYFGNCTKSSIGREIRIYDNRDALYRMRQKLDTIEGKKIYQKRKTVIEPVFGNIKHNLKFREFLLRGLSKVKAEFMLIAIVHNIGKIAKVLRQQVSYKAELMLLPAT